MTCTSCAARIEKKLNRLDGVEAAVNYATEKAAVRYDPTRVEPAELVSTVEATGYRATLPTAGSPLPPVDAAEHAAEQANLLRRLGVSAVLALPVLLLSMVPALQFAHWPWVALALATPVVFWGGWPFHRATFLNLRHGATTMDTLVCIGTLAAYGWSLGAVVLGRGEVYFEVASVVTVFLLAGRYLEARAKVSSGAALRALAELGAKDVAVVRGGIETRIPIAELLAGDLFVVRPGEKIATDGIVQDGSSAVDLSLLTGESVPVEVGPGSAVVGAGLNAGGRLLVRATRVGPDTQLATIARLVDEAQHGKAKVQRLADRVSAVFVPAVLVIAVVTLVVSLAVGVDAASAFTAAVAVLVIACPCALGLATPTALLVGTGHAAQLGLLIRGPEALESTREVDTIVLDKTGTVTTGRMALLAVHPAAGVTQESVLRVAGALESLSEHPIATAIADAAQQRFGELPPVTDFANSAGLGVNGTVHPTISIPTAALCPR